jgi:primosomal protein N'
VLVSTHILDELEGEIYVSTRLFDPSIFYTDFTQIVFVQAHNLLSSPDYLVQEEIMKSIAEVLLQVDDSTKVIFDTNSSELELFQNLIKLNKDHPEPERVYDWYLKFLDTEAENRRKYGFPPFNNLLLLTTQEKNSTSSKDLLVAVKNYLETIKGKLPEVSWSSPYPARFLKRKNLFSHHLLIRYPKQYEHFNFLKKEIMSLSELHRLQVRLNPRHLF